MELNPVRARLAQTAEDYRWSSARAQLGLKAPPEWLDLDQFLRRWPTPASWRATRHDSALLRQLFRLLSA